MIWSNEEEIFLEAGSSGIVRCTAVDTVLCFLLFCGRHKIDDAAWFLLLVVCFASFIHG